MWKRDRREQRQCNEETIRQQKIILAIRQKNKVNEEGQTKQSLQEKKQ